MLNIIIVILVLIIFWHTFKNNMVSTKFASQVKQFLAAQNQKFKGPNMEEPYSSRNAIIKTYERSPTYEPYWMRNNWYYYSPHRNRYRWGNYPRANRRFFGHYPYHVNYYPYHRSGYRNYW